MNMQTLNEPVYVDTSGSRARARACVCVQKREQKATPIMVLEECKRGRESTIVMMGGIELK